MYVVLFFLTESWIIKWVPIRVRINMELEEGTDEHIFSIKTEGSRNPDSVFQTSNLQLIQLLALESLLHYFLMFKDGVKDTK